MFTKAIAAALVGLGCALAGVSAQSATKPLTFPVEYTKLSNGLKVVISPDHAAPTAFVGVYYGVGFRLEPKGRTGFAHLFEHLMFQGSGNLGKMQFIKLVEGNGGTLNGSTRFDFTNYFQIIPSHTVETILWAEADRMKGLQIDTANLVNQQGVVKNEVKVNVLNAPNGGFPWLSLPQLANTSWQNAHNFYGDLTELDAATIGDAKSFFKTYYAPNNAALVIVGDVDSKQAMAWVHKYFDKVPSSPPPPPVDLAEPRQTAEKRVNQTDPLAKRPALALAYHLPDRYTPDWYAFGMIEQLLGRGRDSRFYQEIVQKRGYASGVNTSTNPLGNMFNYKGPMLWEIWLSHDATTPADSIIAAFDKQIADLQNTPVSAAELGRARMKWRSEFYTILESGLGLGRGDLMASFALFDDDPTKINRLEAEFMKVTPEMIQKAAREYLRSTNRTILTLVPAPAPTKGK